MNDSKKVISLADRRIKPLGLVPPTLLDQPVNATWFDAWVELDGSIVIRFDASRVTHERNGIGFGPPGSAPEQAVFKARGNAYQVRIAPIDAAPFVRDMSHVGHTSRRRIAYHRGDHLWRSTPNGDGTYTVEHEHDRAIFEPFKCRLRNGYVPSGPPDLHGTQAVKRAKVAPKCTACSRVVQAGETMYREQSRPGRYRKFSGGILCETCTTTTAPRTKIEDAAG